MNSEEKIQFVFFSTYRIAKQRLFAFHLCVCFFILRSNAYLRFTCVCFLFFIAKQPLFAYHFCVFPFSNILQRFSDQLYGTHP
jgi:hypothetical protein